MFFSPIPDGLRWGVGLGSGREVADTCNWAWCGGGLVNKYDGAKSRDFTDSLSSAGESPLI